MDFIEENSYNTETPTCGTQWGLASQAPGGGRGWGWRHSSSTGLVGAWSGILLGVVVGMYLFSACRINSWPSSIFLVLIITTREPALDATQQFNCTPKIDTELDGGRGERENAKVPPTIPKRNENLHDPKNTLQLHSSRKAIPTDRFRIFAHTRNVNKNERRAAWQFAR